MADNDKELIIPVSAEYESTFLGVPRGISFYKVKEHTFIFGLKNILPEDVLWRKQHPRVPSLVCFEEDHVCDCPWGCVGRMAARCMWFFMKFQELKQILVLFRREESFLKKKRYVRVDSRGNLLPDTGVPSEEVPRVWVFHVSRDFSESAVPYRMFRANYGGLNLVLERSKLMDVPVDGSFWGLG